MQAQTYIETVVILQTSYFLSIADHYFHLLFPLHSFISSARLVKEHFLTLGHWIGMVALQITFVFSNWTEQSQIQIDNERVPINF